MTKQQKNVALGGVAVLLLAAAGFRFYRVATSESVPAQIEANAVCLACQQEVAIQAGLADRPPWKCPRCGQQAVFPWMYCAHCRVRFVPQPERKPDGSWGLPVVPVCPKCGGAEVGSYLGEAMDQVPEGDLPLPPWPPE